MITDQHIKFIQDRKKLPLNLKEAIKHYIIAIIPLIPIGFIIYNNLSNSYGFGIGIWILLSISLIFYYIQRKKLRFKEYKGKISIPEIARAVERTSKELQWIIDTKGDSYIQAFRHDPLSVKGGDLITIVISENTFMINSVSDPRKVLFPLISLTNKENRRVFLKHLKDVIDNKPENKDYLIPAREWTTKKIIMRIVLYPFWLFVIGMSIYMIANPIWFKSVYAGFGGLAIGIGYFILDIKSILLRRKYERNRRS